MRIFCVSELRRVTNDGKEDEPQGVGPTYHPYPKNTGRNVYCWNFLPIIFQAHSKIFPAKSLLRTL